MYKMYITMYILMILCHLKTMVNCRLLLSPLADFFVKGQCHEINIFLMAYKSVFSVYALVVFKFFCLKC
jgi:hypothetical protein